MHFELIEKKVKSLVSKKILRKFFLFLNKAFLDKNIFLPTNKKLILVFLNAEEMRALNKKFLKKDFVTDVLSFSPVDEDSLGELALCVEKILSQAQKHGLSLEEETVYLILHGILHLLGYHHEQGGILAKKMYEIQDDIFAKWQVFKNPC